MAAFLNGASTGASTGASSLIDSCLLPRNGLKHTCIPLRVATCLVQSRSCHPLRMIASPSSITLDLLVFNPKPTVSGTEDKDLICYRVWKQVFGNAYVMESEHEQTYPVESMFRAGRIPLREFVRGLALSSTYRRRFFECCNPNRAVELNFKHLLGRSPASQHELSEHVQLIANKGFEAEINSYIDSVEYEQAFGDNHVPHMRFRGTYPSCDEFNRMCAMYSAPGTSDKSLTRRARALGISNSNHVLSLDGAGHTSKIMTPIATNAPTNFLAVTKGIPSRPDLDHGHERSRFTQPDIVNDKSSRIRRVEVTTGNYLYLSEAEADEYRRFNADQERIKSIARKEIVQAREQISLLELRIAELSSIL